jgi:hypothetical protein
MKIKCVVILLAAAFVLAAAPIAGASRAPHKVIDISFDGYCDGMHLNYASAGLGEASTIDGDQTGCVFGGVFGQTSNANNAVYLTVPGYSTFTVINLDGTWVHYGFDGNLIFVLNSGTWSYGPPSGTGVASNRPRAGALKALNPTKTTDIVFDGYCDGMHLVSPSAGLGTPGTVDGNRTGCASEGLIGAKTKIHGQGTFAVTFVTDGTWIQTAIFLDHTWIHYAVQGDLIYINNTGTWSYGTPGDSGPSSIGQEA